MKLWEVTIERTIFVLADDEMAAEREAMKAESEEHYNDPSFVNAIEVTDLKRVPKDWRDSLPYGAPNDSPVRDMTCEQYLASQKPVTSV
jgi:hypothetical protein